MVIFIKARSSFFRPSSWVASRFIALILGVWILLFLSHATRAGTEKEAETEKKNDVYLSLYALGSWPSNREAFFLTGKAADTKVGNGAGAGLKVAIFPSVVNGFLGIELESFGHSSNITFPLTAGTVARTNLWVFNSMANLILRYPEAPVIPYIGIGGGLSQGVLTSPNIPGRPDQDFESSSTFGYQLFAGVQSNISRRLFVFGEYKYLSANYHWERLSLEFRSQYGLVGVGLRF
ncbi:MAG TPA: outer membrane beta-barrel protein [Nitrospira sp.]